MKKTLAIKIALAGAALGYFAHQCVLEQREQKLAQDQLEAEKKTALLEALAATSSAIQERIDHGDLKNAPYWKIELATSAEFDKQTQLAGI